jgi:hypothetical protein
VINLLLSLLVILVGGIGSPATGSGASQEPSGQPGPVLLPRPGHPRAGRPFALLVVGLPHGAAQVRLLASQRSWPARPRADGAFLAHPVAPAAGPWQADVRFRWHGRVHRELAGVILIRPG